MNHDDDRFREKNKGEYNVYPASAMKVTGV